jgi:hypothetical protein
MQPDKNKRAEAKNKILAHFANNSLLAMKERGERPALEIITSKRYGIKLKYYVTDQARLTGMRVVQGDEHVKLGNDIASVPGGFYPKEPDASRGTLGGAAVMYYSGDNTRAVIGTIEDIKQWFIRHWNDMMAVRSDEGFDFDCSFAAEVRLLSWKHKGQPGYQMVGGKDSALVNAATTILGAMAGTLVQLPDNIQVAYNTVSGFVDGGKALGFTGMQTQSGTAAWNRDLAERYLEFAVYLGPGVIEGGDLTASYTWILPNPEPLTDQRGVEAPHFLISLGQIGRAVIEELLPSMFNKLENAAT